MRKKIRRRTHAGERKDPLSGKRKILTSKFLEEREIKKKRKTLESNYKVLFIQQSRD